jgi:SAM-dependent methyltransferase
VTNHTQLANGLSLLDIARRRLGEAATRVGWWRALRDLGYDLGYLLRNSTPARRKARYGDIDFDWDYRVDTTAANVGWRLDLAAALAGALYQPTGPELFHQVFGGLEVDYSRYTFLDVGSGKGRALLMATDYPFPRVVGIELLPELHRAAVENIRKYKNERQRCFQVESICGDARHVELPPGPLLVYLFNPLPRAGLENFLERLAARDALVVYHNPVHEDVLVRAMKKIRATHQFAVFTTVPLEQETQKNATEGA